MGAKPRYLRGWFWAYRDCSLIVVQSEEPKDDRKIGDAMLAIEPHRFYALFPNVRIPTDRPVKIRMFAEIVE